VTENTILVINTRKAGKEHGKKFYGKRKREYQKKTAGSL
jgi:hypothetical protein